MRGGNGCEAYYHHFTDKETLVSGAAAAADDASASKDTTCSDFFMKLKNYLELGGTVGFEKLDVSGLKRVLDQQFKAKGEKARIQFVRTLEKRADSPAAQAAAAEAERAKAAAAEEARAAAAAAAEAERKAAEERAAAAAAAEAERKAAEEARAAAAAAAEQDWVAELDGYISAERKGVIAKQLAANQRIEELGGLLKTPKDRATLIRKIAELREVREQIARAPAKRAAAAAAKEEAVKAKAAAAKRQREEAAAAAATERKRLDDAKAAGDLLHWPREAASGIVEVDGMQQKMTAAIGINLHPPVMMPKTGREEEHGIFFMESTARRASAAVPPRLPYNLVTTFGEWERGVPEDEILKIQLTDKSVTIVFKTEKGKEKGQRAKLKLKFTTAADANDVYTILNELNSMPLDKLAEAQGKTGL